MNAGIRRWSAEETQHGIEWISKALGDRKYVLYLMGNENVADVLRFINYNGSPEFFVLTTSDPVDSSIAAWNLEAAMKRTEWAVPKCPIGLSVAGSDRTVRLNFIRHALDNDRIPLFPALLQESETRILTQYELLVEARDQIEFRPRRFGLLDSKQSPRAQEFVLRLPGHWEFLP